MLQLLQVKNVALISHLEVEFFSGLNVLSGETGAGKSIIIDAINFVLGGKFEKTLIKHGTEKCSVVATFDLSDLNSSAIERINTALENAGCEISDQIILQRSMTITGKSDARINSTPVTLIALAEISSLLVDIHAQHAHQSLLKKSSHLQIVDSFAETQTIKASLSTSLTQYKQLEKSLKMFGIDEAERARKIDLLEYQINEIEEVGLEEGEEEELILLRSKMLHSERLKDICSQVLERLENNGTAQTSRELLVASSIDNSLNELTERLTSVSYEFEDIIETLKDYTGGLYLDQHELEITEKRLQTIRDIKKKYGADFEAINKFLIKAKAEYEKLVNAAQEIQQIEAQMLQLEKKLIEHSKQLHAIRVETIKKLEVQLVNSLHELGLLSANFKINIETPLDNIVTLDTQSRKSVVKHITKDGFCDVEFLFSANKGQPLKPLAKIVSGGETSRFSLALKDIAREYESVPTLIFDEIDAGIGGKIGQEVAKKLANISLHNQVLCITHLPQIAAMAENHYYIQKHETANDTLTTLTRLDKQGELVEIARLSGGQGISKSAEDFAKELKQWSMDYIKNYKIENIH